MAIGTMCLGAVGVVYVQMAKEQQTGLADATLGQKADMLEDKITTLLQTMSATDAATLGSVNPTNSVMYRQVLVSKGGTAPQQLVYFDPTSKNVYLDPNIKVAGDQFAIWRSLSNSVILTDLNFSLGLKAGNRPDGTLVNVSFAVNDAGATHRRSGNGYITNNLAREFTVRLRGP